MRNISRFRRLRRTIAGAALVAALAVGTPIGVQAANAETTTAPAPSVEASPTILRIATSGFIDTFNPFISIYLTPTNIMRYMYEFLVQNDATDGSPTKGLADSWDVSDDARVWTFHLQDGLTWSDGEPITSADVKYTYDQIMTVPALQNANGNLVTNFESVEAPDDATVVITMKEPQAPNPGIEIPIVPQHIWEAVDDPATYANDSNVVSSGPFLLESYSPNQSITLKANPEFWQGKPPIDGIQYIYYTNSDAQVQALRAGEVDFVTGLTPQQYEVLQDVEGVTVHSGTGRRYSAIGINVGQRTRDGQPYGTGNEALTDQNVRQAIRQGTDTATLLENVLNGYGVQATSFIPSSFPKWTLPADDEAIMPFDPDAAAQKLLDVGWVAGDDGIRVKDGQRLSLRLLVSGDDSTFMSVSEYFVGWMKDIGIEIKVEATDADTVSAKATSGDYDLYFTGWSISPDPDYQLGINTCMNLPTDVEGNGGTSQDGYCDPAFDALYNQQHTETDEAVREETVREMLRMNYTATSQVALWYANGLEAYRSDRFEGFAMQPSDGGIIANQAGYWGFMKVAPVEGATSESGTGSMTGLFIGGGVGLVVVVGIIIAVLMRRRRGADVE